MTSPETATRGNARSKILSRLALVGLMSAGLMALSGCTDDDTPASQAIVAQAQAPAAAPETAPATGSPAAATAAPEIPASEGEIDIEKLMSELALPDVVQGDPNAPITIVEYASMTCDHCAAFHNTTYPVIKKDYIDTGKAKLIIREFPFDPRAMAAFMLARCAPNGNREAMISVLFQKGEEWSHSENASEQLLAISKLAGFTETSFKACLADKDLQDKIVKTKERGQFQMGVDSTPTFFINGKKYRGALKPEQMSAVLDSML